MALFHIYSALHWVRRQPSPGNAGMIKEVIVFHVAKQMGRIMTNIKKPISVIILEESVFRDVRFTFCGNRESEH